MTARIKQHRDRRDDRRRIAEAAQEPGVLLGHVAGSKRPFGLPWSNISKHVLVIGQSGVGKGHFCHLLERAQIQSGGGLLVIGRHAEDADYLEQQCHSSNRGDTFRRITPESADAADYNPIRHGSAGDIASRIVSAFTPDVDHTFDDDFFKCRSIAYLASLIDSGSSGRPVCTLEEVLTRVDGSPWFERLRARLRTLAKDVTWPMLNLRDPGISLADRLLRGDVTHIQVPPFTQAAGATGILGKLVVGDYCQAIREIYQASGHHKLPHGLTVLHGVASCLVPQVSRTIALSRSVHQSLVVTVQTHGQVECLGPDIESAVFNGLSTKVVFRPGEMATAERMAGELSVSVDGLLDLDCGEAFVASPGLPVTRARLPRIES